MGSITHKRITRYHIQHVLDLKLVNREAIAKADLKVVVDAVNSVGGTVIPFVENFRCKKRLSS